MAFSDIFIRKPITTVLVMVSVLIFGIAAYFRLPISDLPSVDYPVITINVAYPGASPITMATTVAAPLENQCMQIPGLQAIISDNTENVTRIMLTFDLNRNIDLAAPDVQAAIQRAMSDLPADLPSPPTYSKTNPSDQPIMYLTVTSDTLTPGQLYDFANISIGQRLSMIEDVSQVAIWGGKAAVRIQVDPKKLSAFQIGINDIAQALKTGTVTIPAGSLNGAYRAFSIEPKGQLLDAKEYEPLIVAYRDGAPIRLRDIATCVNSLDNDVINVMAGRPGGEMLGGSVIIPVWRRGGANTVALAARVRSTVEQLRKEIPGSVKLDIFHDKSSAIIESVNDVKTTIFIALVLVVLVIFLFLGRLSDTIIPAITLPLSVVATFLVMAFLGFSLDNLSLMGIILAVGFVVDDAIVVLENAVRLVEKGQKPLEAAINSAREITGTIVSMTLSLAVIFVPLIFMSGVVGRNFSEFAVTVVAAIICSGVVSLTLTPMMCSRMLKAGASEHKTRFQQFADTFVGGMIRQYGIALTWILQRKWLSILMWLGCMAGTFWLFAVLPKAFMPEGDSGLIVGGVVLPLGTSTEQMRQYQDRINEVMMNNPNVDKCLSVTGMQPGADQSQGTVVMVLKPREERKPIRQVVQGLRAQTAKLTGGFTYFFAIPALRLSAGAESTAAGSQYSYILRGANRDKVYKSALELEQKMRSLPCFVDIQNSVKLNLPQLNVTLLRDRASTLGLTAQDIEYALALAYGGGKVNTYKTDIDQYNIIVELDKKYQQRPVDLSTIYLRSPTTGKLAPLTSVIEWEQGVGPQNVPHNAQLNAATISFNITPGVPLGNATKALEDAARSILPDDVFGCFQGEAQEFEDAIKSLAFLMLIAIFIKYIILGILYENYVHPFTVLTTLPVATFGGLLTLLMFRSELSLYAYIGMFMLLGIVAKNGIMMVDFAEQNMGEGKNGFDAIYNACLVRFRPILMTGLAAIMGAVPIALGYGADGNSRRPLGLIVVGGLIFSQVITLFVTPGIFLYMQAFQEKVLNRFDLFRAGSSRKAEEALNISHR